MGAAQLLRLAKETGSLEQGKLADIVTLREDPLKNIGALRNIALVMKAGRLHKRDGAPVPEAARRLSRGVRSLG